MAERRITEKTGRGVVCFISNYSWLDGLSFAGMRERYLETFDTIRIDNLHGDRIISEYAPDGRTSETVFAIAGQSPGIKVGTAIALLSKSGNAIEQTGGGRIRYRDFHHAKAEERRSALMDSLGDDCVDTEYTEIQPQLALGLPFKPIAVSQSWRDWPTLLEIFPVYFCGVNTNRDRFLVDIDFEDLKSRVTDYFNLDLSHDEIALRYPTVMNTTARFNARDVRDTLLRRGGPVEAGFIRYCHRPFDIRWLYWEAETKLLNEKRPDYRPHLFAGNLWLSAVPRLRRDETEPQAAVTTHMASLHLIEWGANMFPAWLRDEGLPLDGGGEQRRPNLSAAAQRYLDRLGLGVEDLFHHALAVLHDPAYRAANAGALRMEWPRIPLPGWPDGDAPNAAGELLAFATRGRALAALLDPETPVAGVTSGTLRPELAAIAVPSTADRRNMIGDDFALTVGWGHFGTGDAVMPGQGRAAERDYTAAERKALGDAVAQLGDVTVDVYLNDNAYWRNIPAAVWNYKLGGYQVLKKWLSYRESKVLGRSLLPEEVQHFTDTARRIGAILRITNGEV